MRVKLFNILMDYRFNRVDTTDTIDEILSLLGENEIVVLDAPEVKHVGLLDVRGSDASEVKDTAIEQTSGAAFREMIETENKCNRPKKWDTCPSTPKGSFCKSCGSWF